MKTALALLAGVAIGALAIQGLHAQQTPGAQQLPRVIYVAEIDVSNPDSYAVETQQRNQVRGAALRLASSFKGRHHWTHPSPQNGSARFMPGERVAMFSLRVVQDELSEG